MRGCALFLLFTMLAGCAGAPATGRTTAVAAPVPSYDEDQRDGGYAPQTNATVLAIYLPTRYRKARIYLRGMWVMVGKALETGVTGTAERLFPHSYLAEPDSSRAYGLLLAIEPEWQVVNRDIQITIKYKVLSKDGPVLLTGQQTFASALGDPRTSAGVFDAAVHTTQLALQDLLRHLNPTPQLYPANLLVKDLPARLYVNTDKPVSSGTGFFINPAGQVMTAHHVINDCAMVEVRRDSKVLYTRPVASSALLDLAVIDTGETQVTPLPLRRGEDLVLGESVANVGFPLQGILSATNPTLTRGNISSRGGLNGSIGMFQFSAPIQPGSSGGPVVSDGGELLGVTLSTLSPKPLIDRGILPQNVNFALEARYVAQYLRHNNIAFVEVAPNPKGDMQTGNQAALAATVSVACFQ